MFQIKNKFVFAIILGTVIISACIVPKYVTTFIGGLRAEPVVESVCPADTTLVPEVELFDEAATIIVNSQTTADVGELVRFDVSGSIAESFRWLLVPTSADFEVYDAGRQAIFSARTPGEYMFVIACAYKSTVDVTTHIITVQGDAVPSVKPNVKSSVKPIIESIIESTIKPNVGPEKKTGIKSPIKPVIESTIKFPVIPAPADNASLAEKIPYWCLQVKGPSEEARELADSFESIASMTAAGVHKTPEEIIRATSQSNRQALGTRLKNWVPVLRQLQGEFQQMAQDGTLVSTEQHSKAWLEVAGALKMYASLFTTQG